MYKDTKSTQTGSGFMGNVANMLATFRCHTTSRSNKIGQQAMCQRHKIDDVGMILCQHVPTTIFPAIFLGKERGETINCQIAMATMVAAGVM